MAMKIFFDSDISKMYVLGELWLSVKTQKNTFISQPFSGSSEEMDENFRKILIYYANFSNQF